MLRLRPETDGRSRPESDARSKSVLPLAIGGGGLALAVASVYFAARAISAANEAAAIAPTLPDGAAPCEGSFTRKGDERFCDADRERRTSGTIAILTGGAAAAAMGTAVVLAILETRHAAQPPSRPRALRVVPSIGSTSAGGVLDVSF